MAVDVRAIEGIDDPARRAQTANSLLGELEAERTQLLGIRRAAVAQLRASGWSWQSVSSLLGIHRNRAAHLLDS